MRIPVLFLLACLFIVDAYAQNNPATTVEIAARLNDVTQAEADRWLLNISADAQEQEKKGWKYVARWLEEESRHTDGSGNPVDLHSTMKAYKAFERLKQNSQIELRSNTWSPAGPMNAPVPTSSFLIPGTGRINTIAFHPTDADIMWAGGGMSGLWKTTNGGQSWVPLGDQLPVMRVSDIAVNPNNPDEIYICLGDYAYLAYWLETADRKRNTHFGVGVYKTTDGGITWAPTGLTFDQMEKDASLMRRVFIDPNDDNILLAAGMQGIWRSVDRGESWTQIRDTPIWDIERDPIDPSVVYASTAYVYRLGIGTASIIKSINFGETWKKAQTNIPEVGEAQRIEIAISPTDNNYVYAIACDLNGGLYGFYRSIDAGNSWELRSDSPNILHWSEGSSSGGQGTYDLAILVDKADKEKVYIGGVNSWVTEDGGSTWNGAGYYFGLWGPSVHADHHYLRYNPHNDYIYLCHDGGVSRTMDLQPGSWDSAYADPLYTWPTEWEHLNNGLANLSFYRLGVSQQTSGNVFAGAQDMGTFLRDNEAWSYKNLGDGMECIIHPNTDLIMYGSTQYGNVFHSIDGGESFEGLGYGNQPWRNESSAWTTPFQLDPINPSIIYVPGSNVWVSGDGGYNFSRISTFSQFPISAFSVSGGSQQKIYVGKRVWYSQGEPGAVLRSADGGLNWLDITNGTPADSLYISFLETDDDNPNLVWATFAGFADGMKVFESRDGGLTWENISYNLPNLPANCIIQHQGADHNPLYVGMDRGIYYKNDLMDEWQLYSEGIPNVIINDFDIDNADQRLYVATFGRGIWVNNLIDQVNTSSQQVSLDDIEMRIVPNPATSPPRLELSNLEPGEYHLEIVDVTGKTHFSRKLTIAVPDESVPLDELKTSGLYYARLQKDGRLKVAAFSLLY